jgi:hypothetical protein
MVENNIETSGTVSKMIFNKVSNPLAALSSKLKELHENSAIRIV